MIYLKMPDGREWNVYHDFVSRGSKMPPHIVSYEELKNRPASFSLDVMGNIGYFDFFDHEVVIATNPNKHYYLGDNQKFVWSRSKNRFMLIDEKGNEVMWYGNYMDGIKEDELIKTEFNWS